MRTLPIILAASLALAGCNNSLNTLSAGVAIVGKTNATLASLSNYEIPAACSIFKVAQGYWLDRQFKLSAANLRRGQQAVAVVDAICANPPTNVVGALATMHDAWLALQAATKTP